jgi:hypothetical protein
MSVLGMIVLVIGGLAGLGVAAWFVGADSRGCFDPRDHARDHGGRGPFQP